jgi:4-hydroxy-3-methylbut-2-en-1-yl diphosphate reductase
MPVKIKKASNIGFCMGVRRAIDIITDVAEKQGGVETLGALVHNQQVLKKLAERGVRIVDDIHDVEGATVVISAHGVGPKVTAQIASRGLTVTDTTCPFVKRAQVAARKLAEAGFYTVVFGDVNHPEVKGILGWADGKGMATLDARDLEKLPEIPKKLGILSQTTQIPAAFSEFVKDVLDAALVKDAEIHIIDTLCHDIRRRQADTLKMARGSDVVFVIGGRNSANTQHLFELCSTVADTHQIETAKDIKAAWLKGKTKIGVTAGASTDDETIDEVMTKLERLTA